MDYGAKVLSRLNVPGLALLIVGAVLVYASMPIVRRLFPARVDRANVIVKGIGCAICMIGALLLLDLIG